MTAFRRWLPALAFALLAVAWWAVLRNERNALDAVTAAGMVT